MKLLKNIWNYLLGNKKVEKGYGCQEVCAPLPEDRCAEPPQESETVNVKEELYAFKENYFKEEKQVEPQEVETIIAPPQEFKDVSKQNNLIPERFEGESFEEYRKRRKLAELFLKKKKKGQMAFVSKNKLFEKGKTFTRTKSK